MQPHRIAIADVAQKIRFQATIRKELAIHTLIIKTRHWSAIEAERTRCDDEIPTLQGSVAERSLLRDGGIFEPVLRLRFVRVKKGNVLRKIEIVGDDRRRGGRHRFPDIFRYEMRPEPVL